MELENKDVLQSLAQAPPYAPTAQDAETTKANAEDQAAQKLVNATTKSPSDLQLTTDADKSRPRGSWPTQDQPEAPDVKTSPAPGSFADHLSNALLDAKKNADPAALAKPGAWSKLMVGSTMDALTKMGQPWQSATSGQDASQPTAAPPRAPRRSPIDGILANIGDAAAAPGPGGAFGGFARTAAATTERVSEETKQRQLMATSNAQMLHEQALTHKMGEDAINESIATSKAQMDNITTPVPGAPADASGRVIAKDKTSDELNQMIKSGELKPTEETVFPTGRVLTGKDANDIPMYRTTYTAVKPAAEVELSPASAKYLNEHLGYDFPTEGTLQRLPGVQVNDLFQKANNAVATKRAFDVGKAKDDETIRKAQTSADAESIFKNPIVMNAINGHMVSPDDPFSTVKAYNAIVNNPKLLNDPSMPKNFSDAWIQAAGGVTAWNKKVEEYAKTQQENKNTIDEMLSKAETDPKEIEGHTPAFTAAMKAIIADPNAPADKKKRASAILAVVQDVRQGEVDLEKAKAEGKKEAAQGFQGNPNATSPEEFLNSLKPEERSIVDLVHTGRAPLVRLEYLMSRKPEVIEAVERAYPGEFDGSKVKAYVDTYKDFTSGKTSQSLNSGATAVQHLRNLKKINDDNPIEVRIPGTAANKAYQNLLDTVADELVTFYGEPKTNETIASKKKTLGGLTNRDAAIVEQANAMGVKFDSYEQTWKNAAPSKSYQAPMPYISAAAKKARAELDPDYASRIGFKSTQAKAHPSDLQRPQRFPTAVGTKEGSDGKLYWMDVQHKPLGPLTPEELAIANKD